MRARWLFVLIAILLMPLALADEFRPALLEITETQPGWYSVTWKVPMDGERPVAITPVPPESLDAVQNDHCIHRRPQH